MKQQLKSVGVLLIMMGASVVLAPLLAIGLWHSLGGLDGWSGEE